MKKLAGSVFLALVIIVALAYLTAGKEVAYSCTGTTARDSVTTNQDLFFQLNEFSWWEEMISGSEFNGYMKVEVPGIIFSYHQIKTSGNNLINLYGLDDELVGSLSRLSGTLSYQVLDSTTFDGTCTLK